MIINDAKDLQAAPEEIRKKFIKRLVDGMRRWEWQSGEWVLVTDTSMVEKFGIDPKDYPDATAPDKPSYNPDQKALDAEAYEARTKRNVMLSECDWTQVSDAPANSSAWAEYRQALRDLPEQTGFPSDIIWPTEPE